jgi:5-methylthioribose kinase
MKTHALCVFFLCLFLIAALPSAWAQAPGPKITSVAPLEAKVGDEITLLGENLGKGAVKAVYISDDKEDFRATVLSQAADKIVIKVPAVKPGTYNPSIEVEKALLIQAIPLKIQ